MQSIKLLYTIEEVSKVKAALLTYSDTSLAFSYFTDTARRNTLAKQLQLFYKLHNFRPIWFPAGIAAHKTDTLLQKLPLVYEDGLNPKDYFVDSIFTLKEKLDNPNRKISLQELARLDVYTSAAMLMYGLHKKVGKVTIHQQRYPLSKWQDDQHFEDSIALFCSKNLYNEGISRTFAMLTPKNPQYGLLQKELLRYLVLRKQTLPAISFDKDSSYHLKDSANAIFMLKQHLQSVGDLPYKKLHNDIFDSTLYLAVKRFQYRHALKETGIADKDFVKQLNKGYNDIIRKIAINMERSKWWIYYAKPQEIRVNIPEFRAYYFENEEIRTAMNVVVGKKSSPTPIFYDTLEYVVFNPTWGVPHNIATKEMLYKLRKNPSYLSSNGYILKKHDGTAINSQSVNWNAVRENNFPYQIIQKSGLNNSLGKIKFLFPNKAQVYLHDTPEKQLFSRKNRAFSHGCIRLECPPAMAYAVLHFKDWNVKKVDEMLAKTEIRYVVLPQDHKVPVYIAYQTAFVNANGQLHLRDDVYQHDQEHLKLLDYQLPK